MSPAEAWAGWIAMGRTARRCFVLTLVDYAILTREEAEAIIAPADAVDLA